MIQTPQIEPVSNLARDHKVIFAMLDKGPVFLANRSKAAAVLVSTRQWDSLLQRLEDAEDLAEAYRVKYERAVGKREVIRQTAEEFDAMMAGNDA